MGFVFNAISGQFDITTAAGAGSGTVTSVGLTLPDIFSVSGSPVTTSGTLAATLATQVKNKLLAGPTTGADAAPTFRVLVGADLPLPAAATLGGVFSKAAVSHNFLTSISSVDGSVGQAQPAFTDISGSVAASQLPNPSSSTLGGVQSAAAVSHQWINSISTSGVPALSQPAFSDISGTAGLTTQVTGTLPHGNGGTDVTAPGTSGNLLISDGTNWTAAANPSANKALSNLASVAINTDLLWSSGGYKLGPTNGLVVNSGGGSAHINCDAGNVGSNTTISNALTIGGQLNLSIDEQSITNNGSYTIAAATAVLLLHASGTIAAYTVTFTSGPSPCRTIHITSDQDITSFTLSGNSGQTVVNAPTTLPKGVPCAFVWNAGHSQWIRIV